MNKVVITQMTDKSVVVSVSIHPVIPSDASKDVTFEFPFDLVNPRVALQIATLLVSDPTIPQSDCHEKE